MSDEGMEEFGALADLLTEPSLWVEPPADLEDRVVAAVTAASVTGESWPPAATDLRSRRRDRRLRHWTAPFLVGAAAASLAAGVIAVSTRESAPAADATVSFGPGPAAPSGVTGGTAKLRVTPSGLRIDVDATTLPSLTDGSTYHCWVKIAAGLQSCGAFHTGGRRIILWSGVRDLSTVEAVSVTLEPPNDSDPASSGQRVLFGPVTPA